MKKIIILLVFTALVSLVFADLMQPTETKQAMDQVGKDRSRDAVSTRDGVLFDTVPIELLTTYYDYMPGSYNGLPVRVQPINPAEPGGWAGGGIYMTYHGQESPTAQRRVYYTYIDVDGNVITQGTPINSTIVREGYSGVDIDPATGDPLVAWHSNVGGSAMLEVVFTYDLYDWIGGPGLWVNPPWIAIESDGDYCPNPGADEFIWPYTNIIPLENGDRRVLVTSNNATSSTGANANPSENVVVAYADFDTELLGTQAGLDWNHYTIPEFDAWHAEDPEWKRPFKSFAVSEGGQYTAYVGYVINDSAEQLPYDEIFVILNDNYGEGDYTYYGEQFNLPVDNPVDEFGVPTFATDSGDAYNLTFGFTNSGHFNAVFVEDDSKIVFTGALGLNGSNPADVTDNVYWPYCIHKYSFEFDLDTMEFNYIAMDPPVNENAANPDYVWNADTWNITYLPWDTDNDGVLDEYYDDGTVAWFSGWPCWYSGTDDAFHENNFKIVANQENGWLAAVAHDGLAAKYAEDGVEGYESWVGMPEITVNLFDPVAGYWSETYFMNANPESDDYFTELDGMIPAYAYPGDVIETTDVEGHGKVHLMFLDDNSYGSSIQGAGDSNGGTMCYTALDVDYNYYSVSADDIVPVVPSDLGQNYPNPFNPDTSIDFKVNEATNISIEIFNIRGQKVTTLIDEDYTPGDYSVNWNGTDDRGQNVTSGVYLYKMKAGGRYTSTKKMILLK
jgi:hypothetical protein